MFSSRPAVPTARAARLEAMRLGLTEAALELYVASGAPARHIARCAVAEQVAIDAASGLWPALEGPQLALAAAFLTTLDSQGCGGHRGLGGDGTGRIPGFCELGKGRKRATDGRAWTAALKTAHWNLVALACGPGCGATIRIGAIPAGPLWPGPGVWIAVEVDGAPVAPVVSVDLPVEALLNAGYAPWIRALAGIEIRNAATCAVAPEEGLAPWGELFNAAEARIQAAAGPAEPPAQEDVGESEPERIRSSYEEDNHDQDGAPPPGQDARS